MATNKDKRDDHETGSNQGLSLGTLANSVASMGFAVLFFVLIGVFLDSTFHTQPLFILLSVFFSLASIVYLLWQLVTTKLPK